jgi:hypothetical protein
MSERVLMPKGPWSEREIGEFLADVRVPIRIACNGASGHPVVAALWFVPLDGKLWCATQRTASLARILERDPRCGFDVSVESPPYRGVRGAGLATLHDERGAEILDALIERYVGSSMPRLEHYLRSRVDQETAIAIEPRSLVSWDYRERMVKSR